MSEDSTRVCEACGKQGSASTTLLRCSKCRAVYYCSQTCQTTHWPSHKKTCGALASLHAQQAQPRTPPPSEAALDHVSAVELLGGSGAPFTPRAVTLSRAQCDQMAERGVVSPVSRLIGVPLVIIRHAQESSQHDNQAATYLMIDPESGLAPYSWQQSVGPVTVIREDRRPLSVPALQMIWMYFDLILEHFGDEGEVPRWRYAPKAFQEWCRREKENDPSYSHVELPL